MLDATERRPLRAAFEGCDAIMHLAAKKIPRYGGTLSTLEVNVGGVDAACAVALSLDADIIVTSTSDVYGDGTPPYHEDGRLTIGPPTSKRWAYAVSKMYDEHYALALADEHGLRTTILRLFNCYGPRNHLTWWGGPTVTFIEALLDGRAGRDPRRRLPDAASPTSRTPSTASSGRSRPRSRAARWSTSAAST